jgi:hypothetical protein
MNLLTGFKEGANHMGRAESLKLFFACVLSAAIGAVIGVAAFQHMQKRLLDEVTTRRLMIIDSSGKTRALVGTNISGEVSMQFIAPSGNSSLSAGVFHRSEAEMKHTHANGEDQQEWVPYLRLADASGRPTAEMTTVGHGNALLKFMGAEPGSGVNLGYIGDGRDDGSFGAAWGLKAKRQRIVSGVGVLAYDSAHPSSIVPSPPPSKQ